MQTSCKHKYNLEQKNYRAILICYVKEWSDYVIVEIFNVSEFTAFWHEHFSLYWPRFASEI